MPEIDEQRMNLVEQKILNIKEEIKMIESTLVWHWFFCTEEDKKQQILEVIGWYTLLGSLH